MPVPKPSANEKEDAFMARCMKMMTEENKTKPKDKMRPQRQMVAICMNQFRGTSKAEILSTEEEQKFITQFLEKYPEYKPYFITEQ